MSVSHAASTNVTRFKHFYLGVQAFRSAVPIFPVSKIKSQPKALKLSPMSQKGLQRQPGNCNCQTLWCFIKMCFWVELTVKLQRSVKMWCVGIPQRTSILERGDSAWVVLRLCPRCPYQTAESSAVCTIKEKTAVCLSSDTCPVCEILKTKVENIQEWQKLLQLKAKTDELGFKCQYLLKK